MTYALTAPSPADQDPAPSAKLPTMPPHHRSRALAGTNVPIPGPLPRAPHARCWLARSPRRRHRTLRPPAPRPPDHVARCRSRGRRRLQGPAHRGARQRGSVLTNKNLAELAAVVTKQNELLAALLPRS